MMTEKWIYLYKYRLLQIPIDKALYLWGKCDNSWHQDMSECQLPVAGIELKIFICPLVLHFSLRVVTTVAADKNVAFSREQSQNDRETQRWIQEKCQIRLD